MTTVLNPLAYNDIGTPVYYWLPLGTRNRIHYHTFLVEMQKAAIREDPGSFREEKREAETAQKPFLSNYRNPGRSGKLPGRETGREKPTLKKPQSGKIREASGKVSGKRCEHCKSRFHCVSTRFSDTRFPQSGPCVNFMVKSGHTGSYHAGPTPLAPESAQGLSVAREV